MNGNEARCLGILEAERALFKLCLDDLDLQLLGFSSQGLPASDVQLPVNTTNRRVELH